jgi:hypothetical protein
MAMTVRITSVKPDPVRWIRGTPRAILRASTSYGPVWLRSLGPASG